MGWVSLASYSRRVINLKGIVLTLLVLVYKA
ncbi:hypothetical protein Cflav_PD0979 [Pedosphaera parvula Ellin514]|uniref:Uncharacterized protein n=1 Tax=Pedosphaera parvula (strain Ellin514) TaxID=320771 RepID=B9XQ96_PEDPL|nr:hypothetical protein Cflav_PD0979 [Pedosphaera parvula Ellin514]